MRRERMDEVRTLGVDERHYANALRDELPNAIAVHDACQAVRLGSQVVDELRRRVHQQTQWQRRRANVSAVPDWLSDTLCRAVTGDGDVGRQLYTDAGLA